MIVRIGIKLKNTAVRLGPKERTARIHAKGAAIEAKTQANNTSGSAV